MSYPQGLVNKLALNASAVQSNLRAITHRLAEQERAVAPDSSRKARPLTVLAQASLNAAKGPTDPHRLAAGRALLNEFPSSGRAAEELSDMLDKAIDALPRPYQSKCKSATGTLTNFLRKSLKEGSTPDMAAKDLTEMVDRAIIRQLGSEHDLSILN